MSKAIMTVQGAEKLREELKQLKTVRRPEISAAIASAREQQGFCEARIAEIESRLANSETVDIASIKPTGQVIFGATVELYNLDSDETVVYQIVGEDEADVPAGKISAASPIASSVLGRNEGDEVVVNAPKGDLNFEIVSVKHI